MFLIFESWNNLEDFQKENEPPGLYKIIYQSSSIPILFIKTSFQALKIIEKDELVQKIDINFRCYLSSKSDFHYSLDTHNGFKLRTKKNIGEGIRIALVDSGVEQKHPKLKSSVVLKIDLKKGLWDDLIGHGTIMAGKIREIVPRAELIDVKITSRNGLCFAYDVLMSLDELFSIYLDILVFGVTSPVYTDGSDVLSLICRRFIDKGVQLIFPAGNFGPEMNTIGFPDHVPKSFCIGSCNSLGKISFFSSRSSIKPDFFVGGEQVSIIKPNQGFLGKSIPNYSDKYEISGTSVAASRFAGMLALVMQAFPEYGYSQFYDFFKGLDPTSRTLTENIVREKVDELRPLVIPFKKTIILSSLLTFILGVAGILSIFLFR